MVIIVRLKRAYEVPADGDGTRVLVDRLWPRGVSKAKARIDRWFREIAPSTALRRWFGHDPERWPEFRRRYAVELRAQHETLEQLRMLAARGPLTLVYGARDVEHNDAVVLRQLLLASKVTRKRGRAPVSAPGSARAAFETTDATGRGDQRRCRGARRGSGRGAC